ncbi:MAG: YlxR family protein, partial [Lachnospiraceae bacterium]|nr:YlxR family protein [Lachnospiraceae bacterium]
VKIDPTGKLNGRGAYVCKNKECFEKLKKNHARDRSFKMTVPEEFFDNALKELFSD